MVRHLFYPFTISLNIFLLAGDMDSIIYHSTFYRYPNPLSLHMYVKLLQIQLGFLNRTLVYVGWLVVAHEEALESLPECRFCCILLLSETVVPVTLWKQSAVYISGHSSSLQSENGAETCYHSTMSTTRTFRSANHYANARTLNTALSDYKCQNTC